MVIVIEMALVELWSCHGRHLEQAQYFIDVRGYGLFLRCPSAFWGAGTINYAARHEQITGMRYVLCTINCRCCRCMPKRAKRH